MQRWFFALTLTLTTALLVVCSDGGSESHENPSPDEAVPESDYVGGEACIRCHEKEHQAWRGSHHDLAMQEATDETVLGDFDDVVFEDRGARTRFLRSGDDFMVETEGEDGVAREYRVRYTFGADPLQQYLVEYQGGRLQVLTVAWDARSTEVGGQRWYQVFPDESPAPGSDFHWTSPFFTWNFTCAECHSTDLKKNYDAVTDTYATTWSDIDVSCEACHGPGRRHVEAADLHESGEAEYPEDHALDFRFRDRGLWRELFQHPDDSELQAQARASRDVEACARCHSRRSQIAADYVHGDHLLSTHRIQLLTDPYYFADGQVRDEVFVYGSFKQSHMYAKGVTCTDCHEPHSLEIRADSGVICSTCHDPAVYEAFEHHRHPEGSTGTACAECHMPERTYMGVDPRRDHGLRIPRPDLSVKLGVPNACNRCHDDQTNLWSANYIEEWFGKKRRASHQEYAEVFHAARNREPGAEAGLTELIRDDKAPPIARATALEELRPYLSANNLSVVVDGLYADDPMMRRAAVSALEQAPPDLRWRLLAPLLGDPILGVRVAVARILSDFKPAAVDEEHRDALVKAFAEYLASEMLNADRAVHWLNLARFHAQQGDVAEAERAFNEARRREADLPASFLNQADMYRSLGREADCERLLKEGIAVAAEDAMLHHSLGLSFWRQERKEAALLSLEKAFELAPENARLAFVYGSALQSAERLPEAIAVWERVLRDQPNDRASLQALSEALVSSRDFARALPYAEHLASLVPDDVQVRQFYLAIRQALGLDR